MSKGCRGCWLAVASALQWFWERVLQLGLTLWVLRAPVAFTLFGFVVLGLAPQAQDLLVNVATGQLWYILLFLLATFFVWAATTHYAARLLVTSDQRYLAAVGGPDPGILPWLQKWMPRILGSLAFIAMAIATYRSWSNLPTLDTPGVTESARRSLIYLWILLAISFVLYWLYTSRCGPRSRSPQRAAGAACAPGCRDCLSFGSR